MFGADVHTARSRLGLLRAWVCVVWLVRIVPDPITDLARLPVDMFNPMGVLNVVPASAWAVVLDPAVLTGVKWTLCAALLAAALGLATRPALVISAMLVLLHQGLIRGFGFMQHAELPLVLLTLILCVAPCGERWAVRRSRAAAGGHRGALVVAQLLVVSCCCYIGVHRLVYGGWALFDSHALLHYMLYRTYGMHEYGYELALVLARHMWAYPFAVVGFATLTVFEALAPLAVISRRYARTLVPAMLVAHILILLTMNIAFWEFATLYIVLLDRPAGRPESASQALPAVAVPAN